MCHTNITWINSYLTLAGRSRKHELYLPLYLLLIIPCNLIIPGHAVWLWQGGVKGAQGERIHRDASAWLSPENIIQLLLYSLDFDLTAFMIWGHFGELNPKPILLYMTLPYFTYITLFSQSLCILPNSASSPVNQTLLATESCKNSSWRMLT